MEKLLALVIERGMWQGCLLVPSLFLVVGEALMLKSMKNKDLVKSKAFICPCQIGLSLARKKVIVNNILLSSLWYFVNVGRGTKKGILIINSLLNNYLWARLNHNCRCPIG